MYRFRVRDALTTRTMLAEPMTTPSVVSDVFSVLALKAVSAASQMARSITVMDFSRSDTLEAAQCLARTFRVRVDHKRGLIFIDGRDDLPPPLVETPEPGVRIGVRRQIASAHCGCKIDAQEALGLSQVPIRKHEGNTSVIGQSDVRGRHASGLLDDAGEPAGIATRLVVIRDLEVRLDAVWSRVKDPLVFSVRRVEAVCVGPKGGTRETPRPRIDPGAGLDPPDALSLVAPTNPRGFPVNT